MNAKEEFPITDHNKIKCAVVLNVTWEEDIILKVGHTKEEFKDFLDKLNLFNYDSGYGSQKLDGTIWLNDGTWYTREEYDGAEWWEYHIIPEIPSELYLQ